MSALHTPRPWEVGVEGNGTPGYVYCNNGLGSAVAIVYGKALPYTVFSRAEEEANARLIAAAPELLAALIQCQDQFRFYADEHAKAGKAMKAATNQSFADLAQAAINRATAP